MSSVTESSSQTERVIVQLRTLLLTGEYAAGERLTELGLVPRLGASRTPVRHALVRLAHEGLLEDLPSGGFRVRAFGIDEIWDAIEIRGVLEGTAARLAAERLESPDELDRLRASVRVIDALGPATLESFVRYMDLNEAFHLELRLLARSPMLLRTMEQVLTLPFASPGALVFSEADPGVSIDLIRLGQEHHRALLDAIGHREGSRAESLAREHARIARRSLTLALEDRRLFSQVPGASLIRLPTAG
jgi:GntR family transcriptional regulator of vanillate catabolism